MEAKSPEYKTYKISAVGAFRTQLQRNYPVTEKYISLYEQINKYQTNNYPTAYAKFIVVNYQLNVTGIKTLWTIA